ncbi:MAG: methyl-accepting chemotaxis protein, partial [Nitrospirae bacterium]|nr:methyl-accepting chemotaxis protein [Nitrospirota bacterium]
MSLKRRFLLTSIAILALILIKDLIFFISLQGIVRSKLDEIIIYQIPVTLFFIVICGLLLLDLGRKLTLTTASAKELVKEIIDGKFLLKQEEKYRLSQEFYKILELLITGLGKKMESLSALSRSIYRDAIKISVSSEYLKTGIQQQIKQTERYTSGTIVIAQTVAEIAKNVEEAADVSMDSVNAATEGKEIVNKTVDSMHAIADAVRSTSETINRLGMSSEEINEIVNVINEIAEQTNMLALNAAIEAARAGEHGKGFAVVAEEVRKLAERTTMATGKIRDMVNIIQKDVNNSIESMKVGIQLVEKGIQMSEKSRVSLERIIEASRNCAEKVTSISVAADEQSKVIEEISVHMENVSDLSKIAHSTLLQIDSGIEKLKSLAKGLMERMEGFTFDSRLFSLSQEHISIDLKDDGKMNCWEFKNCDRETAESL